MTNNILDVLTCMFDYLFEESEQDSDHAINDTELKAHLADMGFDVSRIDKALSWLNNIVTIQGDKNKLFNVMHKNSMRIYTNEEKLKLNVKLRGFLLFIENVGQLNINQREMVIEQAMSLSDTSISMADLKWVVMMVLGNSVDGDFSAQWLESIMFLDDNQALQ